MAARLRFGAAVHPRPHRPDSSGVHGACSSGSCSRCLRIRVDVAASVFRRRYAASVSTAGRPRGPTRGFAAASSASTPLRLPICRPGSRRADCSSALSTAMRCAARWICPRLIAGVRPSLRWRCARARPLPLDRRAPEHALVRPSGSFLQMEDRALAPFGVEPELQLQPPLLEHLHSVADSVVPAVLRGPYAGPRRSDEPRADRQAVPHLCLEAVAAAVQVVPAHAGHALPAPQRFGAAHCIAAPSGGDARCEAQRGRRRRVVADRDRHAAFCEPFGLVHEQPAHADVDGESRHAVREYEAGPEVHAAPGFSVTAVLPDPDLDARRQRDAFRDGHALRALERGAQPADCCGGRVEVAGRPGCGLRSHSDP